MQCVTRRLFLLAILAASIGAILPRVFVPSARVAAAGADAPAGQDLKWMGVASCASTACHGMNGPRGAQGCEYTTWISHDPHAKAYDALFSNRSKQIEKNLNKLPTLEEAHPEKDALCLKCHAMNAAKGQQGPSFAIEYGVGCESCHGPAEKWLSLHHLPQWQAKRPEEKEQLGMRRTKDLFERAKICTDCHVGTADRQVNHDLIAAGHPRLNFEFGTYLANIPKHWQEKDPRNTRPDFEARVWALGQVASTLAAVELLEARAAAAVQGGKKDAPPGERPVWPEFAEYDCFACHHGLRDEEWRRQRDFSKRAPGSYPWGTWYQALAPAVARQWPGNGSDKALASLGELTTSMSRVYPDPKQVQEQARAAKKSLAAWAQALNQGTLSPQSVAGLLGTLASDDAGLATAGWDSSAQLYLALVALYQARHAESPRPADDHLREQLQKLYRGLEFEPGFSSPRGFKAEQFRNELGNFKQLLGR